MATQMFKTINNLNSSCLKDFFRFQRQTRRRQNPSDLKYNHKNLWQKSISSLGPEIWNSLSEHVAVKTSFTGFRNYVTPWFGKHCMCNLCKSEKKS